MPLHGTAFDLWPVPFNAQPDSVAGHGLAINNDHTAVRNGVELRDVFDPGRARHCGAQRDVQFHQEMRADREVEGLGHVCDLEPGCDAADTRHVDLDDQGRTPLHVGRKLRG